MTNTITTANSGTIQPSTVVAVSYEAIASITKVNNLQVSNAKIGVLGS